MHKVLFITLITAIAVRATAQVDTAKLRQIADSIDRYHTEALAKIPIDSANDDYFTINGYDRFFDKYFAQIKYDRESFTEGNSAALKIADSKTRLNLTLSKKKKNTIFSVGTALNITDGSGVIFSGNKPTAGTEFNTSISYLIPSWRFLAFKGPDQENNFRKRRAVADSVWVIHNKKNPAYAVVLLNDQVKYERLLHVYDSILQNPGAANTLLYRDSLVQTIDKLQNVKLKLEEMDNGKTTAEDAANSIKVAADKISVDKELATECVTWFRMFWLTGGLSYRRDNYATYDSTLSFSARVSEKNFDKWTLNGTLNFFWQRTDPWIEFRQGRSFINSVYANLNYALVRTSSFEDLTEVNLGTSKVIVNDDTTYEFKTDKKIRDVSGKTFETYWLHRIGLVGTFMIGKKQFFGLNLSGSGDLQNERKPVFNSRIGLLFRFKDSENEKSIVNFELFTTFNDLTDTKTANKSVWQRKEIGISATVPFQKVFFR
jgi:hypothetical protein